MFDFPVNEHVSLNIKRFGGSYTACWAGSNTPLWSQVSIFALKALVFMMDYSPALYASEDHNFSVNFMLYLHLWALLSRPDP